MALGTASRMRTSKDNGHFHYIDEIDSNGNGQTKMFINKKTNKRHVHEIRAFVIMIANGHTHRLRGSNTTQGGGGMLAEAPGAEDLQDRRQEQVSLPRGFEGRRGRKNLPRGFPRNRRRKY